MQIKERGIILVPIDFTKQSLSAIKQSYNLAKYTHSKLVLLHVYNQPGAESFEALNKLTKQTEQESGVPTEYMNIKGDIYEETDRLALLHKRSVTSVRTKTRFTWRESNDGLARS